MNVPPNRYTPSSSRTPFSLFLSLSLSDFLAHIHTHTQTRSDFFPDIYFLIVLNRIFVFSVIFMFIHVIFMFPGTYSQQLVRSDSGGWQPSAEPEPRAAKLSEHGDDGWTSAFCASYQ